jgi:pimeloyl-ACP methyl ester carboxylesterase
MRTAAAVPLALMLAVVLAGPARADIAFSPCAVAGYECGHLAVPLDRSGSVPGSVDLAMVRARASSNPTRTAVVALAGGPGQAGTPLAEDFADALGPALAQRDLLVFDQRGTGLSGPLSCPSLLASGAASAVLACARHLGSVRGFYRTPDSVQDLEDIRVAAGYDKLVLYGVSYGTKVALAYAAAHPDHVERLVLDSVVAPDAPDPFRRASFRAVPRMLRDLCGTSCRRFTSSPSHDLTTLAHRLRTHSLKGSVVDGRGKRRNVRLFQDDLFGVLLAGDLNPALRSELPGAVHSALRHDNTPLLRLEARAGGLGIGDQAPDEDINQALFFTTSCEDAVLPWPREEDSLLARVKDAEHAAAAIPASDIAPFSRNTTLSEGLTALCIEWPAASPAPPPVGPLPSVPTLILEGGGDLRTPIESARAVAAAIPGAQLLAVPRTGHSVLGADLTDCSRDAVAAFFADRAVTQCPSAAPLFAPVPPPPTSLTHVPRTAGLPGRIGRTFTAITLTIRDLRLESLGVGIAQGRAPQRIGGLRAGFATHSGGALHLHAVNYVPGVSVSGTVPDDGTAVLRVTGRAAAHGTVRVTTAGHVTGRLGGRRIAIALAGRALRVTPVRVPGPLARVP